MFLCPLGLWKGMPSQCMDAVMFTSPETLRTLLLRGFMEVPYISVID